MKLVIFDGKKIYVSKELFLIAGTHKTNHTSGTIYKTCDKLIMLHPLSKEGDYNFHVIEEKSNKSLQQKAKKSKKQLQHVNPNNRTSDVANIHISCKSSQNR